MKTDERVERILYLEHLKAWAEAELAKERPKLITENRCQPGFKVVTPEGTVSVVKGATRRSVNQEQAEAELLAAVGPEQVDKHRAFSLKPAQAETYISLGYLSEAVITTSEGAPTVRVSTSGTTIPFSETMQEAYERMPAAGERALEFERSERRTP